MLKKKHVQPGEIEIGKALPWPVYDAEETLLLKENAIIRSEKQLAILLEKGLYRGNTKEEILQYEEEQKQKSQLEEQDKVIIDNPFIIKISCAATVEKLLNALADEEKIDVMSSVEQLSKQIRSSCVSDTNATLAAIHLLQGFSYSILHPLHTAILCELLMRRLSFSEAQEQTVMAAALTMNIGMFQLQDELFTQKESLTEAQELAVKNHPDKSVEILKNAGINDKHWMTIIIQHHERINGEGYPHKLSEGDIHQGAKVVALADMYAAMITPRVYRKPVQAQQALKDIFTGGGKTVDNQLAQLLIREVGIYPPGSFVKLANNEIAVVIRRAVSEKGQKASAPAVCSLVSPRGGIYERPVMRDSARDIYKIVGTSQPEFDETINYPDLWGYS